MLLKNLKYAFRNLSRDKFYVFLNGFGLTIGMMVTLLIFMWATDEMSYDNYHKNNGQIYRILNNMSFGGERNYGASTPAPLAPAVRAEVPEVQSISLVWQLWNPVLKSGEFLLEVKHSYFVEPSIFDILDFEFIQGDPKKALKDPASIVLTEEVATKMFGQVNPMGQTINVRDRIDLVVTGIIKATPLNTHLPIECLIPFEENSKKFISENAFNWGSSNFNTYCLLRPGADPETVSQKMTALRPIEEDEKEEDRSFFELQAISDVYLGSEKLQYSSAPRGSWMHIRLLSFIGLLILLIASINYVNLTTARSAHRAKSTGVRKIIGASKSQLIGQHMLEAFALVSICTVGALLLSYLSLPVFEELTGKTFPPNIIFSAKTLSLLGGIAVVTILLSGIQPALQMAAFRPVEVLKGNHFNGAAGKGGLRKFLVVTQFVSSAALIICTLFMFRQLEFVSASKLGYEKEHIFSFRCRTENPELLKNELTGKPGILEVTKSDQHIVDISSRIGGFSWEGKIEDSDLSMHQINVDHSFKDFFGLELTQGRWYRPDETPDESFLINESAVQALQMEDPIGKWIDLWGTRGTIIGVVKDFHFRSFHHGIEQLIIRYHPEYQSMNYVKTNGSQAATAIASAEKVFKEAQPNQIFKYEFLDEAYNDLYKTESRIGSLFLLFALIAIVISCLGIFGLATYTAEKRFKEIGIRKVLGASVYSIVHLLSKDFLKLVFASLVIAIPIAWYFMDSWLSNFAYHINLDWWGFAIAGVLAIGIAFLTVGLQSFRAALSNPVNSIKD